MWCKALQAELQRIQEERKKLAAELKDRSDPLSNGNDSSLLARMATIGATRLRVLLKDSQETCGQLVAQVESLKKESAPNLRRLSEMEDAKLQMSFLQLS